MDIVLPFIQTKKDIQMKFHRKMAARQVHCANYMVCYSTLHQIIVFWNTHIPAAGYSGVSRWVGFIGC